MLLKASEGYVRKLIEEGFRPDERKLDEYRKISIETDFIKKAEGSAKVTIGNTQVIAGVKLDVGEPFPDTAGEGVLIVNAELHPIASPTFETGPPSESAIELARIIDRTIRESKAVDMEKLCITPGEKVWLVNIDIDVLDHDGNLIDASALAAVAALLNTKLVKYEEGKVVREKTKDTLPLRDTPIAVTVYKIGSKLLVDANLEEDPAVDARLTIATTQDGDLCAIQKGGRGFFTTKEIEQAVDISLLNGKELRKLLG